MTVDAQALFDEKDYTGTYPYVAVFTSCRGGSGLLEAVGFNGWASSLVPYFVRRRGTRTPLPAGTVPKYRPDGNLNVNTLRPSQVPAALLSRLSSLYGLKPRRIHRGIFTYFILNKDPTAAQVFYVEI